MSENKNTLRRGASWTLGVFLVITGLLDWIYLSGPAIEMVGKWAPLVWVITVGLMTISCYIFLEMAIMHKDKAGGMATYVIEAFKNRSSIPGLLAMWGYVTSWGLAVAAIATFAGYFVQFFIPDFNIVIGALVIVIGCFFMNLLSVDITNKVQSLIIPGIIASIAVILGGWVTQPVLTPDFSQVQLYVSGDNTIVTFLGACLLISWSAYAMEAVLTLIAEYKDPVADAKKSVYGAAAIFMVMTVGICASLTYLLPLDIVLNDPFTPLLPLAEATFGTAYAYGLGILFIIGLILGVNCCFIASSRVLYEASSLGYLPGIFSKLNKNQSPVGALAFILLINVALILGVGEAPVFMVVAGTIGYLVTVILANFSIYFMRKDFPDAEREFRVPDFLIPVSIGIGIINIIFLVVGSTSYTIGNIAVGVAVLLSVFPLYWYRTKVEDRKSSAKSSSFAVAAAELEVERIGK
ncbi:APC family permease [Methanococcoides methylutens]|uniref:APC family permease n=1 Tax=Methanococcoides methylutens TaxID=2226 RepID=UPI0040445DFF